MKILLKIDLPILIALLWDKEYAPKQPISRAGFRSWGWN